MSELLTVEGYVYDNMEGAMDQAAFLASVDMPIAVIGARGTGKFYVATAIHRETGGAPEQLVAIDCREFRNREEALNRIRRELADCARKTLVFKSPHLMNAQAQVRLAKQLSARRLEGKTPSPLPSAKFVALFPERLEQLMRNGELEPELASVFAGYPIYVPPIRLRKRAILRWAHKILGQESQDVGREVKGFSPDAEQAMLQHDWQGNLTEMRQRIAGALPQLAGEWVSAQDLELFIDAPEQAIEPLKPYLQTLWSQPEATEEFVQGAWESMEYALGDLVHQLLNREEAVLPVGSWFWDEVVLAVIDRYHGDLPRAGEFLKTSSRNLSRWQPAIEERAEARGAEALWGEPSRQIRDWIRELPIPEQRLQDNVDDILIRHLEKQAGERPVALRAALLDVSIPTYQKRLKAYLQRAEEEQESYASVEAKG